MPDWERHGMRLDKALCGWNGKTPEDGELTSIDHRVTCLRCIAILAGEQADRNEGHEHEEHCGDA